MYRDKARGLDCRGWNTGKTSGFFFCSPKHAHRLLSHPSCYLVCADVKNAWSYAATSHMFPLGGTGTGLRHLTFGLPVHEILSVQCPDVTDRHLRELRCVE
jgi:hypothetical protein